MLSHPLATPPFSSPATSKTAPVDRFETQPSSASVSSGSTWDTSSAAMKGWVVGTKAMVVAAVLLAGCTSLPMAPGAPVPTAVRSEAECAIPAELRSWPVFANGRHLRLDSLGGCGTKPFSVEYFDARDMLPREGVVGLGNTDASRRIRPPGGQPVTERIEARYELSAETAECIAMLRVYERPYRLLGPNSSSGLRATMNECGIPMPDHLPGKGGMLSSFPGIDHDAGPAVLKAPLEAFGLYPITDAGA